MRYIRESKERTVYAVKNIFKQPLDSLGQIIPVAMILTSFVGFIVAIFKHIKDGGFYRQIDLLQKYFLKGISKGFSTGNVNMLFSGVVLKIIIAFLVIEFAIVVISYILNESKTKKVIAEVSICIGSFLFASAGIPLGVGFGIINLPDALEKKIVIKLFGVQGMNTSSLVEKLEVMMAIGCMFLFVVVVLMCDSEYRWMIEHSIAALAISFLVTPFTLLIIENIIPMFAGIVAIIVGICLLILLGKFLVFQAKSSRSQGFEETSHYEPSRKTNIETVKKDVPYQKEVKCYSAPFWRGKSPDWFVYAAEDHIYCYNAQKQVTAVCGVSKFEEGTVAIYDAKTKERVMHVEGCKTPKR